MSVIFLKMPIAPNNPVYSFENFKTRYLELMIDNGTSQKIQETPVINEQETHYLISSRLLPQSIADQLISEFPMVVQTNTWPVGWINKEEEL